MINVENDWRGKESSFFRHVNCEYFPCHKFDDPENFNCLFCFCPLYSMGKTCGGDFMILGNGVKDCSACAFPHEREHYGEVIARMKEREGSLHT